MAGIFARQINLFRAGGSYLHGTLTGDPSTAGMPLSVSFELTNHCNLRCPECASGSEIMKRERGFMDPELYKRVISELTPYLLYVNLYFQGEPMMHPGFFSFPGFSGDIFTVVSTNGHFLSAENSEKLARSGLRKLIVSLDGMDQETYSEYRKNGDFGKVIEGIRNVSEAIAGMRSPLKLEIQFLVNKFNEHQIAGAKRLAAETGAKLRLKSMQVIDPRDSGRWMPVADKFRRYTEANGTFRIRNRLPDRCMRLWFNPVVTWDGKVIPCCFDKDAEFVMGDLKNESFRSVWNGAAYKDFRKRLLSGRNKISICMNCTSGLNRKIRR
jgi:radical SAM protein with 4Fe4S-binding SPASM domain